LGRPLFGEADDRPAGSNPGHSGSDPGYDSYGAYRGYDRTDDVDAPTDVYEQYADSVDYEDYDDYPSDTRWRWVAGLAAIVLLVALVAIGFAEISGESADAPAQFSLSRLETDGMVDVLGYPIMWPLYESLAGANIPTQRL
jgi:hypothetical protein